jgi:LPXTG-site transpeptidase (sortase) family protein
VISKSYSQLTWDLSDLEQDVAVLEDIPDQQPENNILLAGHITVYNGSNGPFRYISKLEPGQQVILYNDQFKYTYTVRDQVLVYPDDIYVLQDTSKPQLTLITCATWDEETLSYLRRRVIFADLEQVELNSNNKKYQ